MRKAAADSMVRVDCNRSYALQIETYLHGLQRYRWVDTKIPDHLEYGVGNEGACIHLNKATGDLVSVALCHLASMNKMTYYMSSVIYSIDFLSRQVPDFTMVDNIGCVMTLLFLRNTWPLISCILTGAVAARWNQRLGHPGRLTGLILSLIRERQGSINCGDSRRDSSPSSTKRR
jgi:hypothetical protein